MSDVQTLSELSPASRALFDMSGAATDLPGGDINWLTQLREEALRRFGQAGLPTPKLEDWKYTDLKALNGADLARRLGDTVAEADADFAPGVRHRLRFQDGCFAPGASSADDLPKGVTLLPLRRALADMPDTLRAHLDQQDAGALSDLNAAYLDEGAVIIVDDTSDEDITLALEFFTSDGGKVMPAFHPRNIIVVRKGARTSLLERHGGEPDATYFANHVTTIALEDGASLNHVKEFGDPAGAFNTSLTQVRVGRDASYVSAILATGGQLLRNEIRIELAEEGAEAQLAGAYLGRGAQHTDHTTRIDHLAPNTTSRQIFRGALDGNSRAVFQGNIVVADGADGSDGRLANDTLLLTEGCEIDSKPQLEIYADDVKCAHGSTAGELDDEAMFYLRSRGVPEAEARAMLVEGFISTVFEGIEELSGIGELQNGIAKWLVGGNGSARP